MDASSIVNWSLGLLAGLYALSFVLTAHRFLRMRLGPVRYEPCDESALSEPLRAVFARATGELETLGFEPIALTWMHGPLLETPPAPLLWLRHARRQIWAAVGLSPSPTLASPLRLVLLTYFVDGSSLATVSGEAWMAWTKPRPDQRLLDLHRADWKAQLQDHQAALDESARPIEELSAAEVQARSERDTQDQLAQLVRLPLSGEGRSFGLPWSTAMRLTFRALFPSAEMRRLRTERSKLPAWEPEGTAAAPWIHAHMFRQFEALLRGPVRPGISWGIFVLTALLFVVSMSLYGTWTGVAQLTLVLLVHEIGHWAAMRLFGYARPAIFFIPFFGAATTGTKHDATLPQRLAVLAAGPAPGLVVALLLLWWSPPRGDLHELAAIAALVNAANLLPVLPLDGGRIVQQLLTVPRPWLEAGMVVLSVAAFLALGVASQQPVLFAIALVTALPLRNTYLAARMVASLRVRQLVGEERTLAIWTDLAGCTLSLPNKLAVARMVTQRLEEPVGSGRQRAAGWAAYLLLLGGVVAAFARAGQSQVLNGSQRYACSEFAASDYAAPSGFPQLAQGIACQAQSATQLAALRTELEVMAELPSSLCLREPWVAGASEHAAREAHARESVVRLAQEARAHHSYVPGDSDSEQDLLRGIAKNAQLGLAAVETLHQQRPESFEPRAAEAYMRYLRSTLDPEGPRDEQEAELASRALEESLGRGRVCPAPFRIFYVAKPKRLRLRVTMVGDPRTLASQMCRRGCVTIDLSVPQTP